MKHLFATIPDLCAGLRLDQAAALLFPELSRSQVQKFLEEEHVFYEGRLPKKGERVVVGKSIEIVVPSLPPSTVLPEKMAFSILYEDEALFVINKPPHQVVHPAHGNWSGTVANGLLAHIQEEEGFDPLRPGIVHRLDKDTSGVLIAAKRPAMVQAVSKQFHDRTVYKRYEAILVGEMKERQRVTLSIGRDPKNRKKMACVPNGRQACSELSPLVAKKGLTYASIEIQTGRTHQIRVHAASLHHPVLGDDVYGRKAINKEYGVTRQMLHAAEIKLLHPITHRPLCFKAPLPHDMATIIALIK